MFCECNRNGHATRYMYIVVIAVNENDPGMHPYALMLLIYYDHFITNKDLSPNYWSIDYTCMFHTVYVPLYIIFQLVLSDDCPLDPR